MLEVSYSRWTMKTIPELHCRTAEGTDRDLGQTGRVSSDAARVKGQDFIIWKSF